jgi:molybdopterin-binding protein
MVPRGALCVRRKKTERRFRLPQSTPTWRAQAREGEPPMPSGFRLSARNQIKGRIIEVRKGATTSHVRVDIGNGNVITASITNEAVDELGLKSGGNAIVVIKASDVMIAVE